MVLLTVDQMLGSMTLKKAQLMAAEKRPPMMVQLKVAEKRILMKRTLMMVPWMAEIIVVTRVAV